MIFPFGKEDICRAGPSLRTECIFEAAFVMHPYRDILFSEGEWLRYGTKPAVWLVNNYMAGL